MARLAPLIYRLSDPGFTIYHRAALGGLAATVRAWRNQGVAEPQCFVKTQSGGRLSNLSSGVSVDVEMSASEVRLNWQSGVDDRQALAQLLSASFRLTDEGLIYLPGQGCGRAREDALLAIHNGIVQTFLQHNKKRPGKGEGSLALKVGDAENPAIFTFKRIDRYSHQVAQGSGLLCKDKSWKLAAGDLPETANLTQSVLPGAMEGSKLLDAASSDVFLLQYLMVACPVFLVRSRRREEKVQSCIVVPDVDNLELFAMRLHRLGSDPIERFSNTYLGRVVGGAEEAALRFLLDLRAESTAESLGVGSFLVVGMGLVPWDASKKQRTRSLVSPIQKNYPELAVFNAAATHLSRSRVIRTKKGSPFAIPDSPVPELVAANLAAGEHWCAHFRDLMAEKNDFTSLLYRKEGLRAMKDAIHDKEDCLVIERFQKAWEMTMGALGDRAKKERADFSRLVEVERERIRNDLLRTRTSDQLAGWLLNFMARASREKGVRLFAQESDTFRRFIFNPRNAERLKNLLLFALVSYGSDNAPGGDPDRGSMPSSTTQSEREE